jgi:hypothetical protein
MKDNGDDGRMPTEISGDVYGSVYGDGGEGAGVGAGGGVGEEADAGAGKDGKKLSRRKFVAIGATGAVVAGVAGAAAIIPSCVGAGRDTSATDPSDSMPIPERETPTSSGRGTTGSTRGTEKADDDKTTTGTSGSNNDKGGNKTDSTSKSGDSGDSSGSGSSGGQGSAASGSSGSGTTGGSGNGSSGSGGGGSTGGGNSGTTGGGGSGSDNRVWHEGWNEWVVDVAGHYEQRLIQPPWDEETGHYGDICNVCGAEVTGNFPAHVEATGHMGGYANYHWFRDEVIHHDATYEDVWVDEQGHNVWHEGYWE